MKTTKTALALAISSIFITTSALADDQKAHVDDLLEVTIQALGPDADVSELMSLITLPDAAASHVAEALAKRSARTEDEQSSTNDDDATHEDEDEGENDNNEHADNDDANDHGEIVSEIAQTLVDDNHETNEDDEKISDRVHDTLVDVASNRGDMGDDDNIGGTGGDDNTGGTGGDGSAIVPTTAPTP